MDLEPAVASIRALLNLPPETGERFPEEWKIVRRRIEIVHSVSLPRDTEPAIALTPTLRWPERPAQAIADKPAGAPRFGTADETVPPGRRLMKRPSAGP